MKQPDAFPGIGGKGKKIDVPKEWGIVEPPKKEASNDDGLGTTNEYLDAHLKIPTAETMEVVSNDFEARFNVAMADFEPKPVKAEEPEIIDSRAGEETQSRVDIVDIDLSETQESFHKVSLKEKLTDMLFGLMDMLSDLKKINPNYEQTKNGVSILEKISMVSDRINTLNGFKEKGLEKGDLLSERYIQKIDNAIKALRVGMTRDEVIAVSHAGQKLLNRLQSGELSTSLSDSVTKLRLEVERIDVALMKDANQNYIVGRDEKVTHTDAGGNEKAQDMGNNNTKPDTPYVFEDGFVQR